METFKNIIRSYRQKFANVAAEIYKVSITALHFQYLQTYQN